MNIKNLTIFAPHFISSKKPYCIILNSVLL